MTVICEKCNRALDIKVIGSINAAQPCECQAKRIAELKSNVSAMVKWREVNQPDVWSRGIWDAINEAWGARARIAEASVKELEAYVGVEMTMSDFQTAGDMRKALNAERRRVKELEPGIKAAVAYIFWDCPSPNGRDLNPCDECPETEENRCVKQKPLKEAVEHMPKA